MFPSRDDLIAHVERHALEEEINLALGVRVDSIDRTANGWLLETTGEPVSVRQVVVATGYEQEPVIPNWPGLEGFAGTVRHACDYANARPFRGARVLVVGAGCSGMEIAYDLADGGAGKVWLSARTPPNIVLRRDRDRAAFRATSSACCCCASQLRWGTPSLGSAAGWLSAR